MMTAKTVSHINAIVNSPADEAPVAVEDVIAFSPSADHAEAADIVADVVTVQYKAAAIINPEVANMVTAAVVAVVRAEPEVVVDSVAITAAIVEAISDMPAPEAVAEVVAAVVEVIATATGVETVAIEVQQQIADVVGEAMHKEALDWIDARLNAVDSKLDSLLGN